MSRISWTPVDRHKWYGAVGIISFEIRKAVLGYRLFDQAGNQRKWNLVGNFATVEAAQHEAEARVARGIYASPSRI